MDSGLRRNDIQGVRQNDKRFAPPEMTVIKPQMNADKHGFFIFVYFLIFFFFVLEIDSGLRRNDIQGVR
jgi:hypothetical protein